MPVLWVGYATFTHPFPEPTEVLIQSSEQLWHTIRVDQLILTMEVQLYGFPDLRSAEHFDKQVAGFGFHKRHYHEGFELSFKDGESMCLLEKQVRWFVTGDDVSFLPVWKIHTEQLQVLADSLHFKRFYRTNLEVYDEYEAT